VIAAVPLKTNSALSNPATAGFLLPCPCASDQRARAFFAHSLERAGGVPRVSLERAIETDAVVGRGDQACGRHR